MVELLKNVPEKLKEYWSKQTKNKKITIIVLFVSVILLSVLTIYLLNKTEYSVLYSGLSDSEAGEIYRRLVEDNYDVKVGKNGVLYVPKKYENQIRLEMAAEGYPKSGLNYDIFENGIGFGTTEFEKQKYMQFQLQDRLQDTIRSIDLISDAIVTLTIPDNSNAVIKGDKQPTTASVLIKAKNNATITNEQVDAIVQLVAKSVAGLKEENITIIDQDMRILNRSNSQENTISPGTQYELQQQVALNLENQIKNMLEPVFGYGNIVTGVNVRLNFDKQSTESIKFEPVIGDDGIIVSLTELTEIKKNLNNNGGSAGQDSNGGSPGYVDEDDENIDYKKISRTVNYEVNQIIERVEAAQGQIEDLSVSVVIDTDKGDEELINNIKTIVANAVGVDSKYVVVQTMLFAGKKSITDLFEQSEKLRKEMLEKEKSRTIILILVVVSIVLVLFIVFLVIIVSRRTKERQRQQEEEIKKIFEEQAAKRGEREDYSIDFDSISGKEDYKESISQFYKKNPEMFVQLIRNWLNEE